MSGGQSSANKGEVNTARTSYETRFNNSEVPSIRAKFSHLLNLPEDHLEPLKLTQYKAGWDTDCFDVFFCAFCVLCVLFAC